MSAGCTRVQVLKFGGDAVATGELITRVAEAIAERCVNDPVVAVTSARRGITDSLLALANQVSAEGAAAPRPAAADRAVAAGEIVTASLVAAALEQRGIPAVALDAREAGIRGRSVDGSVRLSAIKTGRIRKLLAAGITPIIAGFQVYDGSLIRIIGRGGSDLTAVALAAALGASRCSFFKNCGLKPQTHHAIRTLLTWSRATIPPSDACCGTTRSFCTSMRHAWPSATIWNLNSFPSLPRDRCR